MTQYSVALARASLSDQFTHPGEPDLGAYEVEQEGEGSTVLSVAVHYADPTAVACLNVLAQRPWNVEDDWRWAAPNANGCVLNGVCVILLRGELENPGEDERTTALNEVLGQTIKWDYDPLPQIPGLFASYSAWMVMTDSEYDRWWVPDDQRTESPTVCTVPELSHSLQQTQAPIDKARRMLREAQAIQDRELSQALQSLASRETGK